MKKMCVHSHSLNGVLQLDPSVLSRIVGESLYIRSKFRRIHSEIDSVDVWIPVTEIRAQGHMNTSALSWFSCWNRKAKTPPAVSKSMFCDTGFEDTSLTMPPIIPESETLCSETSLLKCVSPRLINSFTFLSLGRTRDQGRSQAAGQAPTGTHEPLGLEQSARRLRGISISRNWRVASKVNNTNLPLLQLRWTPAVAQDTPPTSHKLHAKHQARFSCTGRRLAEAPCGETPENWLFGKPSWKTTEGIICATERKLIFLSTEVWRGRARFLGNRSIKCDDTCVEDVQRDVYLQSA